MNRATNLNKAVKPRIAKKSSREQQAVVDEILQVVRDQGKRMSLSGADYRHQQRFHSEEVGLDETFKEDSGSWCTSSSDVSYSPPVTPLEFSARPYFSQSDGEQPANTVERNDRRNGLPPLDPRKVKRPTLLAPAGRHKLLTEGSKENTEAAWSVRPKLSRPKSARGERGSTMQQQIKFG